MNRTTLMNDFKDKFGGEYTKENGRWYWLKENVKQLVSNSWLMHMLKTSTKQEEPPYAVSEHTQETLVENTRDEAPLEEQESSNETAELSKEELKKEKERQRRKERRAKKKLEKQNESQ